MPTPTEVLEQLAEGDSLDNDIGEAREVAVLLVREAFRRVDAIAALGPTDCGLQRKAGDARASLNALHVHLGGQCVPGVEQAMMRRAWEAATGLVYLVLDVPVLSGAQTRDHAELPQVRQTPIGRIRREPDGTFELISNEEVDRLSERLRPAV